MPTLSPLGPKTSQEVINAGFKPEDFRFDEDLQQIVPYAQAAPSRAASIGASFAQPIAELPAGAARGNATMAMDLADAVPSFMSRAAYGSTLPTLIGSKLLGMATQPIADKLAAVPKYDGTAEKVAGVLGSLTGGLGIAAIPGAGLPALIGAYGANRYGDIRAKGGSPLTAGVGGAIDAAAVAVPPLKTMGMPIGRAMVKGGLLGGGVNAGQQLAQNVLADVSYAPGTPLMQDMVSNTALGFGMGSGTSGLQAKYAKPATQADVNQIAGQPVDPTRPPILNMGGSDNLTGKPTVVDPGERSRQILRQIQTPNQDFKLVNDLLAEYQQLNPNLPVEEVRSRARYEYRNDPTQWTGNIRKNKDNIGDYGDPKTKLAAKLLNEGVINDEADFIAIMQASDRDLKPVENMLRAKGAAAAAEKAKLADEAAKAEEAAKAKEAIRQANFAARLQAEGKTTDQIRKDFTGTAENSVLAQRELAAQREADLLAQHKAEVLKARLLEESKGISQIRKDFAGTAENSLLAQNELNAAKAAADAGKQTQAIEQQTHKANVKLQSEADAINTLAQEAKAKGIVIPEDRLFTSAKELGTFIKDEEKVITARQKARENEAKRLEETTAKTRESLKAEQDAIDAIRQEAKLLDVELPDYFTTPKELQAYLDETIAIRNQADKGRVLEPGVPSAAVATTAMRRAGTAQLDPLNAVPAVKQTVSEVPGVGTPIGKAPKAPGILPAEPAPKQAEVPAPKSPTAGQPIKPPMVRGPLMDEAGGPAVTTPKTDGPVPESPETILEQFRLTLDPKSSKAVTLLVKGTPVPELPEGLDVVRTQHGLALFNPGKTTYEAVVAAGKGANFDGRLLGLSQEAKPPVTPENPPVSVVTETPAAKEAIAEVVPNEPAAVADAVTAQKAAVPEGTQRIENPLDVVAARNQEGPKQGDPITKAKPRGRLIRKADNDKSSGKPIGGKSEKTGEAPAAASPVGKSADTTTPPKGMGAGLREKMDAKKGKAQEGGFIALPTKTEVREKLASSWKAAQQLGRSSVNRLRSLPGGEYVGDKISKLYEAQEKYSNTAQNQFAMALNGATPDDLRLVNDYRLDMYRDGISGVRLNPKQQKIADLIGEHYLDLRATANTEGAWVNDGGIYRPGAYNQYYTPQVFKSTIWDRLKKGDLKLKDELIAEFAAQGRSQDEAEQVFRSLAVKLPKGQGTNGVEYGALRKPEGVDYPRAWLKDLQDSGVSYINNWSSDMAMSKVIEQDPIMATLRGDLSDSRGGMHTADPAYADRTDMANEVIQAIDVFNRSRNPNLTAIDKLNSMASRLTVMHETGARDVLGSLPTTWMYTDLRSMLSALGEVLTPGSFSRGRAKGYISTFHRSNQEQGTLFAGDSLVGKTLNLLDKAAVNTGLTAMQDFTKLMGSFAGEVAAKKALRDKDAKFFKQHAVLDPFTRPPQEVIDEVANRIQKNVAGSYDGRDIPDALVTGSDDQIIRLTFGLARYAIGQTNRQLDHVVRALRNKDPITALKPLVVMALGGMATSELVDYVVEELSDKKPNDLTWAEWFRLDEPESARFLLSKLARANFGGYAMQLAAQAANLASGVKTYAPRAQALDLVESMREHSMMLVNKMQEEGLEGRDFLTIAHEFLKDIMQDYRLLMKRVDGDDNGAREKRIYDRLEGDKRQVVERGRANPLLSNTRFNRADTIEELRDLAPKMFRRSAQGKPVPAVENSLKDPEFYQWLKKMQPDEAGKMFDKDMKQQKGINQVKSMLAEEMRWFKALSEEDKLKWDTEGNLK